MSKEPKYKNLVLSGGSIKAIAQIGAIKRLVDEKLIDLQKLDAVVGTSAGAMLGFLIVLGFPIEDIWEFVLCLDIQKLVNPDVFLFLKTCGVESGEIINNLLEEIATMKTKTRQIDFRQLFEITKINFTVVGSCLTARKIMYYNHVNTPDFKVAMALRISISVPGFFTPVVIGDDKYIDGGILKNYAIDLFDDRLDETIGILVCSDYNTHYDYPEEFFLAILNLLMHSYYNEDCDKYVKNTVYIRGVWSNTFLFNFNLNNDKKHELYQLGVKAAEEFLEKVKRD